MAKAIDVANFFVDVTSNDPEDAMTNMRVNKLLYFSQAWSLVRLGRPLFEDDEIQAWQYGPVAPGVYRAFSEYGRERIRKVAGDYSWKVFSVDETELLLDVLREYGIYTSAALVKLTHRKGSPWSEVYAPGCNATITNESMKTYYSAQEPLPEFTFPEVEEVGYRDPDDGLLVLPADWDDDEDE